MAKKTKIRRLLLILGLVLLALLAALRNYTPLRQSTMQLRRGLGFSAASSVLENAPKNYGTSVHFIDVGQGDATLIEQNGHYCLVDTGPAAAEDDLLDYLHRAGVSRLELLVLTHPHSDHIGNALAVLKQYNVDKILIANQSLCSAELSYTMVRAAEQAEKTHTPLEIMQVGAVYSLGTGTLQVLSEGVPCEDYNNICPVLLYESDSMSLLLSGDAEQEAERAAVERGLLRHADIYKMGHHGSATSSSEELLQIVTPNYAVVSCGKDNEYGHPHASALNRVLAVNENAQLLRTDEMGTAAFYGKAAENGAVEYTIITDREKSKETNIYQMPRLLAAG